MNTHKTRSLRPEFRSYRRMHCSLRDSTFVILLSFVIRHSFLATLIVLGFMSVRLAASDHRCDTCERYDRHACAGWPQCISRWARPSYGCHEWGCYVGGGAPFHGEGRYGHEGTWGWDYHGRLFTKRIWLGWHHGRRDQGGDGAYRTDGPHLLHH